MESKPVKIASPAIPLLPARSRLGLLFLLVFILVTVELSAQSDTVAISPAARENESLRRLFRTFYPNSRDSFAMPPRMFLETFIDQQIDHYVMGVEERLRRLMAHLTVSENLRIRLLDLRAEGREAEPAYAEGRILFRKELEEVEDAADRLRDHLEMAAAGLKGKSKLEYQLSPERREDLFGREILFIRTQVDKAETGIRDYLFRSTNTVSLEEIQGQNMLVRLHWAEQMAKRIRGELD